MMPNIFGYVRCSPMNSAQEQQIEDIRERSPSIELRCERGVRGYVQMRDRPIWSELLSELSSGDTLVVWWIECLGGNDEDLLDTLKAVLARGVIVETIHYDLVLQKECPISQGQIALLGGMASYSTMRKRGFAEAGRQALRAQPEQWKEKYRGRRADKTRHHEIASLLLAGYTLKATSIETGASVSTVKRIKAKLVEQGQQGEMRLRSSGVFNDKE